MVLIIIIIIGLVELTQCHSWNVVLNTMYFVACGIRYDVDRSMWYLNITYLVSIQLHVNELAI